MMIPASWRGIPWPMRLMSAVNAACQRSGSIYTVDDGCMAYLDYSALNADGEPPVVIASYNGAEYEVEETAAEDFGAFLLELVEEQLEEK